MSAISYGSIISSRYDGEMYLAAIWRVINSDGAEPGELILFDQMRKEINESLRVRGWEPKDKDGNDVVAESDYKDSGRNDDELRKWCGHLREDGCFLLARSLVADIYRMIWKDGKFSVGEKNLVDDIVKECGLTDREANLLCQYTGYVEYFDTMVRKAIEGAGVDDGDKRSAERLGERLKVRERRMRENGKIGVIWKFILALALPCVFYNAYTLHKYGRTAGVVRQLVEVARVGDGVVDESEYREIKLCSKELRYNCDSALFNSIAYYDVPDETNGMARVGFGCGNTCITDAEVDCVVKVADAMLKVAVVGVNGECSATNLTMTIQGKVDFVEAYLRNWGFKADGDAHAVEILDGGSVIRCRKMGVDTGHGSRIYDVGAAVSAAYGWHVNHCGK